MVYELNLDNLTFEGEWMMKKEAVFFLIITLCLLYVKIEYQSYIGSRLFGAVTGFNLEGQFEKSDVFLALLYFFFLPKTIYKIFIYNFKNTGENKKLMVFFIIIYFYIIELLVAVEFLRNDSRIRAYFRIKKEMIPERVFFSLISPVNLLFLVMVLVIFLFMVKKKE